MAINAKYSLQRSMLIYFLLIAVASLLVGMEFVIDMHGPELKNELLHNFEKFARREIILEAVFQPIETMRNKAVLMIAIIMFVMIIVLTMFVKNITEPLQHLIDVAKNISRGDLRHSVTIHARNELAELGNVINELSSNLQETTLLSKKISAAGVRNIEKAVKILERDELRQDDRTAVIRELDHLRSEFGLLDDFIDNFSFYTVD